MNSCDFFIKQVYCLGLHFVTRLKFAPELSRSVSSDKPREMPFAKQCRALSCRLLCQFHIVSNTFSFDGKSGAFVCAPGRSMRDIHPG